MDILEASSFDDVWLSGSVQPMTCESSSSTSSRLLRLALLPLDALLAVAVLPLIALDLLTSGAVLVTFAILALTNSSGDGYTARSHGQQNINGRLSTARGMLALLRCCETETVLTGLSACGAFPRNGS